MEKERTSILLDKDLLLKLKNLARISNKSASFLIREAVSEYIVKKVPEKKISIIGAGNSESSDVANNEDEYLEGLGED